MSSDAWHEIWERKGSVEVDKYDLETLIAMDGFDVGAGRLSAGQFRQIASLVTEQCDLGPGTRLLEVGCGAGALLWCLRGAAVLFGVDYSASLIRHARAAIPEGTFAIAEAVRLPFEGDAIVCHSVFQYFPTYAYGRRALDEFRRTAPVALILDVPDLELREEAERARAEGQSRPGTHLYYPRSFFAGATVWTNDLAGYANGPYRFNALLDFRR